jgi:hypothetical protein
VTPGFEDSFDREFLDPAFLQGLSESVYYLLGAAGQAAGATADNYPTEKSILSRKRFCLPLFQLLEIPDAHLT